MTTADLIKGWRTSAGLTRMQLAGRIDRYVASVSGWERGATCSAETVAAIGRACGVPDLQRLEAVAQAAGEGEGWARLRAVLGPVAREQSAEDREIEADAERIYNEWCSVADFRPWVPGGNSHKQDEARALARARRGTP